MESIEKAGLKGKKVLVRVDFNVPLDEKHNITDDTRLKKTIPTIKHIIEAGGSAVLMSHMGRPKGEFDEDHSLKHVIPYLKENLNTEVKFAEDCVGEKAEEAANSLKDGEVLLLENLRFHKEEKQGDEEFSKKLAKLADIYVNDAFGTSHRDHCSVYGVAKLFDKKYAGLLLQNEIKTLDHVFEHKEPVTLIMGGSKVGDKIGIIKDLFGKVDNVLIGGAMANTFVKAKGGSVGDSKVEDDKLEDAKNLLAEAEDRQISFYIPDDFVVAKDIEHPEDIVTARESMIPKEGKSLDIGAETRDNYSGIIETSGTIIWNGPMGVFEKQEFATGTNRVAEDIATASREGAFTVIGGGDTTAAVKKIGVGPNISHISTGGGAMLEYLAGYELPGIKALEK
ncbi:MAG: phosphoglycerate kinase [Candidatus Cyclobacteriaceae bacterium M2_1C_046]